MKKRTEGEPLPLRPYMTKARDARFRELSPKPFHEKVRPQMGQKTKIRLIFVHNGETRGLHGDPIPSATRNCLALLEP